MRSGLVKWYVAALAAVALIRPAFADDLAFGKKSQPAPVYCPPAPLPAPTTAPTTEPTAPAPAPTAEAPTVDALAFGATGGGETFAAVSSAVGYIDSALPISQIRIRSDAAYNMNRPDRAEFFYAKCGCLAPTDPNAQGPPLPETRINSFQETSAYIEYAPTQRLSGFVEVPFRAINPEVNANAVGLSDINAGAKYAWIYDSCRIVTTQLRVYTPTGNAQNGLGTNHYSIEPSLLFYQRLTSRMNLEGEFRDWIPVGGTDYEGNVLRYGLGLNYLVWGNERFKVYPVGELVGWTVLNGKQSAAPEAATISANGDTIVNAKFGVRTQIGKPVGNGIMSRADVYAGYGRALTGDFWYKDVMRFELRVRY